MAYRATDLEQDTGGPLSDYTVRFHLICGGFRGVAELRIGAYNQEDAIREAKLRLVVPDGTRVLRQHVLTR